jgi:hypothetical protein
MSRNTSGWTFLTLRRRLVPMPVIRLPRTGQLLATSRKVIGMMDRELIQVAEPLLVAALGGAPALCASCSEPAISVAFPRTLACERHLRGD